MTVASSCKKESVYKVTLPEETTSGQNTLGFLYGNSNIWTSLEHGIFFLYNQPDNTPNADCTFYKEANGKKTIQLRGSMRIKDNNAIIISNSSIQITLQNTDLTSRSFSFDTTRLSNWVWFTDNLSSNHYYNYAGNSFHLSISKLDTVQKIISGNFFGTLYKRQGTMVTLSDTLGIRSGRFDIQYVDY